MIRLPFLLALTTLLLLALSLVPAASPADTFHRRQQDFAQSHNDWAKHIDKFSPASPDYSDRVREEWQRRDLGQKFRRLEAALKP